MPQQNKNLRQKIAKLFHRKRDDVKSNFDSYTNQNVHPFFRVNTDNQSFKNSAGQLKFSNVVPKKDLDQELSDAIYRGNDERVTQLIAEGVNPRLNVLMRLAIQRLKEQKQYDNYHISHTHNFDCYINDYDDEDEMLENGNFSGVITILLKSVLSLSDLASGIIDDLGELYNSKRLDPEATYKLKTLFSQLYRDDGIRQATQIEDCRGGEFLRPR